MRRKTKSIKTSSFGHSALAEHSTPLRLSRSLAFSDLKYALENEAQNCKALAPSHPREQAVLLRAAIEALVEKDAEIAKLQAQITKDANRLDWAAGLVQPDHLRDQLYAWVEQARNTLDNPE